MYSNLFDSEWMKFFEISYDGIIIADGDGKIVYMNPASEAMEEVSKDYILGKYAKDLEEEGIYETSVTVKVLKNKTPQSIMQFKGGKQLVITGIPIFEKARIKWVFINERNVTELNQVKRDHEKAKKRAEEYKKELDALRNIGLADEAPIVKSPLIERIMELLLRIAPADITVLIEGESGVGKDVFAKWIHTHSNRNGKPFIKIDCGSLPETLLESELFGYEKGAFTGASKEGKKGLTELADSGTLFLDEIGELSLRLQVKLLRLLQEQVFIPVGGLRERKVDLRIIAATNRDLQEMVDAGTFRKDLYYRLSVVPIRIPPLRERSEELIPFIQYFLHKYNSKYGYHREISPQAVNALYRYNWPGNVRELSNVLERLVVVTPRAVIQQEDVVTVIPALQTEVVEIARFEGLNYESAVASFEAQYFRAMLERGGTLREMAEALGMSESSLKRKLRKYQLGKKRKDQK